LIQQFEKGQADLEGGHQGGAKQFTEPGTTGAHTEKSADHHAGREAQVVGLAGIRMLVGSAVVGFSEL
jgi:hypothetical protein